MAGVISKRRNLMGKKDPSHIAFTLAGSARMSRGKRIALGASKRRGVVGLGAEPGEECAASANQYGAPFRHPELH